MHALIRLAAVCTVVLLAMRPAHAELTVEPRVTVDADRVTLGDLFRGLPAHHAGAVVAAAPAYGAELLLRPYDLARTLAERGLDWQPSATLQTVAVLRAGEAVAEAEVKRTLLEAVRARAGAGMAVDLASRDLTLYGPPGGGAMATVETLNLDPAGGRFEAILTAAPADPAAPRLRLLGRAVAMAEVPVLRRDMPAGQPIGPGDIDWTSVPADRLDRAVVNDLAEVVGRAPRRPLAAGQPLKARDLVEPVVVAKGQAVTLTLLAPGLQLSAAGRALENGAEGATIPVMNLQSKRTVHGVVLGPQLVQVASRGLTVGADAGRARP